jgi:ribose transport system permease protein
MRTLVTNTNFGLGAAVVILFVILSLASSSFFTEYNLYTIARNMALYAFVGLTQGVVLVVGDMNLSAGAIGGLATITAGYLMDVLKVPSTIAVIAALAVGILCGLINGVISSKFKINAFVVTLATSFVFTGVNFGFTQGNSFVGIPLSFTIIGKNSIFNIPYMFIFMIIVLIFLYFFYNYSVLGRRLLAIGQNHLVCGSHYRRYGIKRGCHNTCGYLYRCRNPCHDQKRIGPIKNKCILGAGISWNIDTACRRHRYIQDLYQQKATYFIKQKY